MWFKKRKPPLDELLEILQEARALLARPDNDFCWSSWEDADAALKEVDGVIASIKRGDPADLDLVDVLFVVTGPICEVAVSSGWGEEYARLGDRVDTLIHKMR